MNGYKSKQIIEVKGYGILSKVKLFMRIRNGLLEERKRTSRKLLALKNKKNSKLANFQKVKVEGHQSSIESKGGESLFAKCSW